MYLFLLALIYIAFISLGLPGFAAWLRLAGHACRAWRAGVVYGDHFNDHFRWDGCIEPVFGQNDPKIWNQNRNGCQRISDRYCTVWIFLFFAVLDAGHFCSALWIGSRFDRLSVKQLCGASLQSEAYELAALLLGCGHSYQSVYHGLCADEPDVEQRLSHHWIFAAGYCPSFTFDAAGLEYQQICNGNCWKECRTGGCAENQGRSLPAAWFFLRIVHWRQQQCSGRAPTL